MENALSVEHYYKTEVLKQPASPLKIFYGASRWGAADWIGEIYPKGTKEKDFLSHYVEHFNAVELNATHYKTFTPAEIKKWADKTEGKQFLFCPKVPQQISHHSSFVDIDDQTKEFIDSISAFGSHLGPVFLQVSDRFSPKRKESLYKYLQILPKNLQFFVEVRNPEWFEEAIYQQLLKFLTENNVGLIINDSPGRVLQVALSIPKCFIRYTPAGNSERVLQWFNKISDWGNKGLTEAFFFVQPGGSSLTQLEELQHFKQLVQETDLIT